MQEGLSPRILPEPLPDRRGVQEETQGARESELREEDAGEKMIDVVSSNVARKLKEAGYPQDKTEKCYVCGNDTKTGECELTDLKNSSYARANFEDHEFGIIKPNGEHKILNHTLYSAPSVGELLEELPESIYVSYMNQLYQSSADIEHQLKWIITIRHDNMMLTKDYDGKSFRSESLVDTCGLMWLWLKKEKKND